MRERFDETFYEEVNSFMGVAFGDKKLDDELKHFIEQELKKEREEIVNLLEKEDVKNCDEDQSYAFQKKGTAGQVGYQWALQDIINIIKNRV